MFNDTKEEVSLPKEIEAKVLKQIVVLLITVNDIENLATRSYLQPLDGHENIYKFSKRDDSGGHQSEVAIYYIGKYGACPAAIRKIQPGSEVLGGAASVPRLAYCCFSNLGAIIGVGVACGVDKKKVKMCDVLVSSKVINYDKGRAQDGGFISRGETINASPYLKELFSQLIRWPKESFKKQLIDSSMPIPEVKAGGILSGPYLLDDPVLKQQLIKDFATEAIGIEMEGAYLFAATQLTTTNTIIVKAVCDYGDGKKSKEYQPTAALMAADFVNMHFNDTQVPEMLIKRRGSNVLHMCLLM